MSKVIDLAHAIGVNTSATFMLTITSSPITFAIINTFRKDNLLRDLTVRWQYPGASYDYSRLGQGTTQEALFTTYKMRSKYEGKLLYINQEDLMLTPLSVFKDNIFNGFRFVPGKITIDYKNAQADLSLVELLDSEDFEPGGAGITIDFLAFANSKLYEFNYLYEKY